MTTSDDIINVPVPADLIDQLTMSVELMLGMEMYDDQGDPDMHDFGLTYEGLETLRDLIYKTRDDNNIGDTT